MLKKLFSRPKKNPYGWFGDYSSWSAVLEKAGGYDKEIILERTKNALLKVKNGEAAYERDSVTFDKKEYPYALIAFLQLSASIKKRAIHVVDFGGSLGTTYYQVKDFFNAAQCASWNIVEQPHYVDCGKANFEDQTLRFYKSIEECQTEKKIDLVLLSSSVQYLEKPHDFLHKLALYDFPFLVFDRTAFNNSPVDRLTLQVVPPNVYPASYPSWFFDEEIFLSHFSDQYKVIAEFPSYVEGEEIMCIDERPAATNKGFYLINKSENA